MHFLGKHLFTECKHSHNYLRCAIILIKETDSFLSVHYKHVYKDRLICVLLTTHAAAHKKLVCSILSRYEGDNSISLKYVYVDRENKSKKHHFNFFIFYIIFFTFQS